MDLRFIEACDLDKGNVFVIMVGPPGSGKTTIAKQLVSDYDFVRVSPDEIRKELSGNSNDQTNNDEVFGIVYSDLEELLENGKNVVYDATNCRSAYRYKILNAVNNFTRKIICICAMTSISDCLSRNNDRNRHVPEDVIERMYFTLKKHSPTLNEGYDIIVKF